VLRLDLRARSGQRSQVHLPLHAPPTQWNFLSSILRHNLSTKDNCKFLVRDVRQCLYVTETDGSRFLPPPGPCVSYERLLASRFFSRRKIELVRDGPELLPRPSLPETGPGRHASLRHVRLAKHHFFACLPVDCHHCRSGQNSRHLLRPGDRYLEIHLCECRMKQYARLHHLSPHHRLIGFLQNLCRYRPRNGYSGVQNYRLSYPAESRHRELGHRHMCRRYCA